MMEFMTQEQVDQFYRDGYVRIPNFLSQDQVLSLLQRSKDLLAEFSLEDHPLTKFTTSDEKHIGDDYFLGSGDKIRYFLEEEAVDESGKLTRDKTKAVNKIGHALHVLDPVFRSVTLENGRLRAVVRDLKFHYDPVALQSMVIFKQPEIGGAVPEHMDSWVTIRSSNGDVILHVFTVKPTHVTPGHSSCFTSPSTALGFWIPLERCTESNGALSFLPGSHLTSSIIKRFIRKPGGGTTFEDICPPPAHNFNTDPADASKSYVLQTCEPGDLVLIHGKVLHKSERNTSSQTRYAYTFHMIDSPPHAYYDEKNWLQPTPSMPFPKILSVPNGVICETSRAV